VLDTGGFGGTAFFPQGGIYILRRNVAKYLGFGHMLEKLPRVPGRNPKYLATAEGSGIFFEIPP
jgi:hypothetical protein